MTTARVWHTAGIDTLPAARRRAIASAAVLVVGMGIVIVVVAGLWAWLYDPLLDPNPNGSVTVFYPGTRRAISSFEGYAMAGVAAAVITGVAACVRRPLSSLRAKAIAASAGPAVLTLGCLVLVLVWWSSTGFGVEHLSASVPLIVVVVTSAALSSAGFLAAIEVAQRFSSCNVENSSAEHTAPRRR